MDGMGLALSLSHYENLPPDILRECVARMTKEGAVDDGTSWPKVSKVCKGWRDIAGRGFGGLLKPLRPFEFLGLQVNS